MNRGPVVRNLWLVAAVAAVVAGPVAWLVWRRPPAYEAQALLRVVDSAGPRVAATDTMVLGRALDRLEPEVLAPAPASRGEALAALGRNLASSFDPATGVVEIVFTSRDRRTAPLVVNAIAEAYRDRNADASRQALERHRASIGRELEETDSLLLVAETELAGLREIGEQAQIQTELESRLGEYESALDRLLELRGGGAASLPAPGSVPAVASDPVAGPLYRRLVGYRAERQRLLTGPGARAAGHPDVQRLNTLIASTEARLVPAIGARIGALRGQVEVLGSTAIPSTVGREAELAELVGGLQQAAAELRRRYGDLQLEEVSRSGAIEIIESATRALPARSNAWTKIAIAILAGLLLGSGVAMVRERLTASKAERETIAPPALGPEELEEIASVPTLAVIPEVRPSLVEPAPDGDYRPGPLQSGGLEAYRTLRANLTASRWGLRTLVVTSAHPGEGKTTTSTNLAATYARQGQKVVLVECDLRRPSLGRYFGIAREIDLMDVLFGNRDWRQAIQMTKTPGLYVILGEKSFPKAGDSLGGPEMQLLLEELSSEYDLVILDTSPLLVAADATALGPIVDGVLIVVRASRADRRTQEEVVRKLTDAGASIVGTVLNDPEGVAS
ncbi:MAG TPA: polysaccharide biosynthesis tyrosine autokinase [Gemmatimonadota bacterium]